MFDVHQYILFRASNITYYSIDIAESSTSFKIVAVFTDSLIPYPAEIGQNDNQMVLYLDSHYFFSPYLTQTQKTTVKLTSSQVESVTKLEPQTIRGGTITFGPYKQIDAEKV